MKLWLLRPNDDLPSNDDPWHPWFDKCFGFVVRAESDQEARQYAHEEAGDEKTDKGSPWLNPKYSTCEELTHSGDSGVIIKDSA